MIGSTVRYRTALQTAAVLAAWVLTTPIAAQEEPSSPRTRLAPLLDPDEQATTNVSEFGEQMRRLTPITEAEVRAADASFRAWVERIRTGRADKPTMRLYAFFQQRLDPFDALVPEGWRERGVAALRDRGRSRTPYLSLARAGSSPEAGGAIASAGIAPFGRWIPIGPFTIPGRTTGLDRPEGQPGTLYAAVADGGVWRTRDFAATWEPLTDKEETLSGGAVLVDPSNPRTIYFGTGEGNGAIDNYGGIGVLKSVDEGLTWTKSNPFSSTIRRLAMHKSEPARLYAAGYFGCYLSTDAGATFALMSGVGLPINDAGASDVLIRPDNPDVVFCAIWGGPNGGIYRSVDHGASFALLSNGLPGVGTAGRIALAISKSSPNVMLAGIDIASGTVYKTVDGGDTWTALGGGSAGYCGGQCWYDTVVGIDSADPNVLYVGGVGLRRSLDGGASWAASDSGVHVDHHFILTPAPGEVFTANDGGVYRSTNQAGVWANWGLGMDTTQYYGICRHPTDADWAMGGTQDNGSHRRSPADTWVWVLGADGGMCMTGPPGSNVVLGEYQNHNMQRSTDGGDSFSSANGGIPASDPKAWVGVMEADPTDRHNMWTGTSRLYRSLDARATNWQSVSFNLNFGLTAGAIAVAPSNSNIVYAGFGGGGVNVCSTALAAPPITWTNIRQSYLPQRGVRRIRVHPSNADTAYVVFGGYGVGKIWKTVNRGGAYTDVTGDLPDVPVNDLAIDPANPSTLVAATDLGVFRSDDDGAHWYGWSTGFPTVASIELTHDAAADRLRVGTHGRSMWEWREAAATPVAVPDGASIPGTMMRAARLGDGSTLRVTWDTLSCTARDYNLFYGDLADVALSGYLGASCGLGAEGSADLAMPSSPSGNLFFVIASSDGAGNESPHGYAANGIGLCGISAQVASASCP